MIKFRYVCDKCGFETKEERTNMGIVTSVPIFTDEDLKWEVDANIAEFMRQAALSDYDWSVE